MFDFPRKTITVRYNTADYGPHSFDLEDAAPTGAVISSVTVKSYSGQVKPGADLALATETTTNLIDAVLTAASGNYTVNVYLNYPGSTLEGNHTLVFEVTWDNNAIHPYYFYKVKVH
jgi:hypothetical protein